MTVNMAKAITPTHAAAGVERRNDTGTSPRGVPRRSCDLSDGPPSARCAGRFLRCKLFPIGLPRISVNAVIECSARRKVGGVLDKITCVYPLFGGYTRKFLDPDSQQVRRRAQATAQRGSATLQPCLLESATLPRGSFTWNSDSGGLADAQWAALGTLRAARLLVSSATTTLGVGVGGSIEMRWRSQGTHTSPFRDAAEPPK